MLNLNKNRLIHATEIIAYWGEIKGDISKQTDLVELTTDLDTSIKGWVESKGYVTAETLPEGIATESWVQSQGYLTEHQDLSDYALKTEIPSLDGYATQEWVTNQGYITSIPDTFATKNWVTEQGYLTEHQSLDGYATEEWVNNQLTNYTTNSDFTSLQNRVITLETNYGDALNITNQILG